MPVDLTKIRPQVKSIRAIYWRGFLVSLTNPKTLLFFGAFFPQFIVRRGTAIGGQIFLLSATFLVLAIVLDGAWAILAGHVRTLLATRGRFAKSCVWRNVDWRGFGPGFGAKAIMFQ
jgi:threonine/homoserine/homoserine lactone efflux protein